MHVHLLQGRAADDLLESSSPASLGIPFLFSPQRLELVCFLHTPSVLSVHSSFAFDWFLVAFSFLYLPVFPKLYCYMFGQRRKTLEAPKAVPKTVPKAK
jgi:hypothetical protein